MHLEGSLPACVFTAAVYAKNPPPPQGCLRPLQTLCSRDVLAQLPGMALEHISFRTQPAMLPHVPFKLQTVQVSSETHCIHLPDPSGPHKNPNPRGQRMTGSKQSPSHAPGPCCWLACITSFVELSNVRSAHSPQRLPAEVGVRKEEASRPEPIELEGHHARMVLYHQRVPSLGAWLAAWAPQGMPGLRPQMTQTNNASKTHVI